MDTQIPLVSRWDLEQTFNIMIIMTNRKYLHLLIYIAILIAISSCQKNFLKEKPSSSIIQPQTLDELQLLLENMQAHGNTCDFPLLSSDEIEYLSFDIWNASLYNTQRNSYVWAKDIYQGETQIQDWQQQYRGIFYANNILVALERITATPQNEASWKLIKGWALFCRAYAYFDLIKNFSPAYDSSNSQEVAGVPIKLNPSVDEILPRSTQQQTYDRIFQDLTEAAELLDDKLPANRNRPSKISCHALAARIYLSMRMYPEAETHADKALGLYNELIDFNIVNLTSASPFSTINNELIYQTVTNGQYNALITTASNSQVKIPESIIHSYELNDLRIPIYFTKRADNTYLRKRGYQKSGNWPFTGLATDELYLIKSECAARRRDLSVSLKYLNDLLLKRYKTGTFLPISISTHDDLLKKVLLERQKELIWRGLRWDDIKRFNKEGANIILTRNLNGLIYTLSANDVRYVFPIPINEINISRIPQNPR